MRFSLEGRVPFLDFNLLKYLFSLSDEAIIQNGWNKNILRQSTVDLLPEIIRQRRNKIGFTTPEKEWFIRMKNRIYSIFLSESFAKRKYFNQAEVLKAFQLFIEEKVDDSMLFWRMLNVEIWLRIFIDSPSHNASEGQVKETMSFKPNEGKKIEMEVEGKKYYRYPIRTELFKKGDYLAEKISRHVFRFNIKLEQSKKWFVVVSEKVVALSQGRSYFIWDIKSGFWAKLLAKFVKKTPYGIGLGSQWTMQLAINEIGLPRILFASLISLITKPFGIKGMFYRIAGNDVNAIDGPTEYSLYPSNVSAKLGPKNPQLVGEEIHSKIAKLLNGYIVKNNSTTQQFNNFLGVVIIDANDLGQNVLGNTTSLDNKLIEKIFSDNPMGQADEQTPLVLVVNR